MMSIPKWLKSYLLVFILFLLVFFPINYLHSYVKVDNESTDFHLHMLYAAQLEKKGPGGIPAYTLAHSAWEYLLVAVNKLFGFSFRRASLLLALGSVELTALILLLWFWPVLEKKKFPLWKTLLILLGVSIAAPISLLWPVDKLMYLGYIGITSYHSPTLLLLKPFAILQFIFAYRCFYNTPPLLKWQIVCAGLVSLLGTYIKPNFSICILPALAVFAGYRLLRKEYVHLQGLIFGFGLPVFFVLIWQFFLTYYSSDTGGIALMPLKIMSYYSGYLGIKLLLSILFPLSVLVFCFREVVRDARMVVGWLCFIFGAIFTYFFAETGPRIFHGNFTWSGEITLLILFVMSTLFCLENFPKLTHKKISLLLSVAWILHVIFGIAYYFYCCFNRLYF